MVSSVRSAPMPRLEVADESEYHAALVFGGRDPVPAPSARTTARLISLDVFRGLVILAMLLVNNLGDGDSTSYFWKHADWPAMKPRQAWVAWWGYVTQSPDAAKRLATLPLERFRLQSQLGTQRVQLRLAEQQNV